MKLSLYIKEKVQSQQYIKFLYDAVPLDSERYMESPQLKAQPEAH